MQNHDAIRSILTDAGATRDRLLEHEVYRVLELATGIAPPRHRFVPADAPVTQDVLDHFPPGGVVLKIVSPQVVHKSDAGGVRFCDRDGAAAAVSDLIATQRARAVEVHGTLIVERVPTAPGFGAELFVGIRQTREFGPVIAAGLGGTDMEYLAGAMRSGRAVARAVVGDTTAEEFLGLFRRTASYDCLTGLARGHARRIGDEPLLACFDGLLALARSCCAADARPRITELEINPFVAQEGVLIPLDGRARLDTAPAVPARAPRPTPNIQRLLEPQTIAVVGVSAKAQNFGRIILKNILACGFPPADLRIIKPDSEQIDGVRCVRAVAELDRPADLLVVAAGADQLPALVEQSVASGLVRSLIVIPGGAGETEDSTGILRSVQDALARSRTRADGGPVLIGPNCLGVQSRPGRYDTFFIPDAKLDKRLEKPGRPVAIVSQSGAFIVSRLSNLETLDPRFTVSIGNQADLTIGDMLRAVASRGDIQTVGVYVEGFAELDGLATLHAIRAAARAGKTVVFYEAGRTEQGRSAAAGHTASVAGDYDICRDGAEAAGAMVAESFGEFERLLELAVGLHAKPGAGTRLGAISNAGFETVGMADNLRGEGFALQLAELAGPTRDAIGAALEANRLSSLVNIRNPLDLTPMAGEPAYEACARAMLMDPGVDVLVVSAVPLTPAMATTQEELDGRVSLATLLPALAAETTKPIIAVVDAGALYQPLAHRLRDRGIPVFHKADEALRTLGIYLSRRAAPTGSR